jgi:hypothetical protein
MDRYLIRSLPYIPPNGCIHHYWVLYKIPSNTNKMWIIDSSFYLEDLLKDYSLQ